MSDLKMLPIEPLEIMWDGLARSIMMWLDMTPKTPRALFQHLRRTGVDIPEWLENEPELKNLDHVPSKGTRCVIIYRAMVEDYLKSIVPICTCLSELALDAYGPGGPMSGHPLPEACLVHRYKNNPYQNIVSTTWPHGGWIVWNFDTVKWEHLLTDPKTTPIEEWVFEEKKINSF